MNAGEFIGMLGPDWSQPCCVCGQRLTVADFRRNRVVAQFQMTVDGEPQLLQINAACCVEHLNDPQTYPAAVRAMAAKAAARRMVTSVHGGRFVGWPRCGGA